MNKEKVFDELLVMKCQEGDKKAFELLFNRWNKKLVSFSYKYLRDLNAAKDVVQESWISAFKSIGKLQHPSKFSSWIFRLTYNKSIDYLRKTQKMVEQQSAEMMSEEGDDDDRDKWSIVNSILNKLPIDQKAILTLFYLENKSVRQIAEIFDMPEGTIKSRIFYAREKLKKKYKEVIK